MKILSTLVLSSLVFVSFGCGTILHGSNQQVMLQSEPSGAEIYSNGNLLGRTPMTATFSRGQAQTLTFKMAGYGDQSLQVARGIDGVALVGDILLGVVPLVVDFATGSMYKLSPSQAIVVMRRDGAALTPAAAGETQVAIYTRAEIEQILGPDALVGATLVQP